MSAAGRRVKRPQDTATPAARTMETRVRPKRPVDRMPNDPSRWAIDNPAVRITTATSNCGLDQRGVLKVFRRPNGHGAQSAARGREGYIRRAAGESTAYPAACRPGGPEQAERRRRVSCGA